MNKKIIIFSTAFLVILGIILLKGLQKAPVAVSGTVEFEGKPVKSVKIKLYQLNNIKRYWDTHTDEKGRFSFHLEQLPNLGSDYVIQAEQYLYLKQNVWSQIFRASEEPMKFNISLKEAVGVKGTFMDKNGIAFEYMDLLFRNENHAFLAKTSYGGEFNTDLLPNARYVVYATQPSIDDKNLREFGELTIGNENILDKKLISNVDIKFPYIKNVTTTGCETKPGDEDRIKVTAVGKPWLTTDLQYIWSATAGEIKGTGAEIIWVAPQEYGKYTLTVKVIDPEGDFAEYSIEMTVRKPLAGSRRMKSIFSIFN